MSKKRLEEIGKNATGILNMGNGEVDSVDLPLLDFTWLYKYAKEQTDHVEELEKKLRVDNELFEKQVQQNKRYRDHLKYMLDEAKVHKKIGHRIQNWALIKDLERALEGDSDE